MLKKTALTVGAAALLAGFTGGTAAAAPEAESSAAGTPSAAGCTARWHGEFTGGLHQRVHLTATGCGVTDGVMARMDLSNGMSTECKPMNADGYVFFDVPSFVDATATHWC
ncbi:hypothetical protein [Prauserella rugosa]|uniref:Alpha amylase inhibitor n=1 Tax=Prauserella rugosa TaxID=43354 RepID=A0A660CJT9_9PSEU|nr:hypothetical protein [Prauserella rugosa]KMS92240.1 hypothetical protein ACZ91_05395 [Streptomyces regensis]TWH22704.1 hypothetical protein JD82_04594 [Prauserella rugosa]